MDTIRIEYDVRSEIVSRLLSFFSKIAGARIKREYIATAEEIEELKKSKASGIGSIENVKKMLRQ